MNKILRVACYIRVSTEEQAKHGYSVATQKDNIKEWIEKQENIAIVDYYIDDGVSADKLKKRTELQRLLTDIQDKKVDMVVFTKLDRWFRSVQKYYQIQQILDDNNVTWKAIHEDYETVTSSGKFKVNIMLSVAQQERDRCSERINDVFKHRIKNGYAVTGATPLGLKVVDSKVVPDEETKYLAIEMFDEYERCGNATMVKELLQARYGFSRDISRILKTLQNTLYIGKYRDNDNYCEPIISVEQFNRVQELVKKNLKKPGTRDLYVFSGLVVCDACGKKMAGSKKNSDTHKLFYYRCNQGVHKAKICPNSQVHRQDNIEQYLLDNVERLLSEQKEKYEVIIKETEKKKPKSNRKAIEKKVEKLNDLYVNDFISFEKYTKDREYLLSQIIDVAETTEIKKDLAKIKEFLQSDFKTIYKDFTTQEKMMFWRGIVDEIRVNGREITSIKFL